MQQQNLARAVEAGIAADESEETMERIRIDVWPAGLRRRSRIGLRTERSIRKARSLPREGHRMTATSYEDHAEGDMVTQALSKGLTGGNAKMYTDRGTCNLCRNSIAGQAEQLDLVLLVVRPRAVGQRTADVGPDELAVRRYGDRTAVRVRMVLVVGVLGERLVRKVALAPATVADLPPDRSAGLHAAHRMNAREHGGVARRRDRDRSEVARPRGGEANPGPLGRPGALVRCDGEHLSVTALHE
ncbi:hypothetical protein [Streptomyces viridiviolaceus]|nr:hypothetical protein [Streptomyces viridiviolaceus]